MKRFLTLTIACVMVLSMLTGCAKTETNEKQVNPNPAIGTGTAEDLLGEQPKKGTLARIQDRDITEDSLSKVMPVLRYIYQKNPTDADWDEFKSYAVEYLVSSDLYKLLLKDNNLAIDEKKLEETFDTIVNSTGNKDDFYKEIEKYEVTDDDVKDFLRSEQAYSLIYEFASKDVAVDDTAIKAYYDENIKEFSNITTRDFYQVSFEKEEDAKKALDSILNKSKTFEDVAKENKAEKDGYISTVSVGDLVAPFEEPAWKLKENEVDSNLISSEMGFHIITVKNFVENKTYTLEDVKDKIKQHLLQTGKDEAMKKVVNAAVLKYSVTIY